MKFVDTGDLRHNHEEVTNCSHLILVCYRFGFGHLNSGHCLFLLQSNQLEELLKAELKVKVEKAAEKVAMKEVV